MANKYIRVNEQIEAKLEQLAYEGEGENKTLIFEAKVSQGNLVNANGRLYPTKILSASFAKIQDELHLHPGLVDHPDPWNGIGESASDVGIKWLSFKTEGDDVIGKGQIVPTRKGKDLQAIIESGLAARFSTRARALFKFEEIKGQTVAVAQALEMESVDAVLNPSVRSANIKNWKLEGIELDNDELNPVALLKQNYELESKASKLESELATATKALETLQTVAEANKVLTEENTQLKAEIQKIQLEQSERNLEAYLITKTQDQRFSPTIVANVRKTLDALKAAGATASEGVIDALIEQATASVEALNKPEDKPEPKGKPDVAKTQDNLADLLPADEEETDPEIALLLEALGGKK